MLWKNKIQSFGEEKQRLEKQRLESEKRILDLKKQTEGLQKRQKEAQDDFELDLEKMENRGEEISRYEKKLEGQKRIKREFENRFKNLTSDVARLHREHDAYTRRHAEIESKMFRDVHRKRVEG